MDCIDNPNIKYEKFLYKLGVKKKDDIFGYFIPVVEIYMFPEDVEAEKERFYCSCCGKEIKSRTTTGMCRDCCNKKQQEKSNCPSKEELLKKCYELKAYSKIAKEYGVSDKTIRKWCDKYGFTLKDLNIKPDIKPSKKNLQAIANKYSKPVYQFNEHGKFLKEFPSLTEAARSTNISKSCIMQVTQGKRLTAGGFVWRLKYN